MWRPGSSILQPCPRQKGNVAVAHPSQGGVPKTIVPARVWEAKKSAAPCLQQLKDAPSCCDTYCCIPLQVSKGDNCEDPREADEPR